MENAFFPFFFFWDCVFSVHCNLGCGEGDIFLLPPPLSFPGQESAWGKRKLSHLLLGAMLWTAARKRLPPSPFCGSNVSTPVCSLWPLLGILSLRVGTFGYYVWGRETFYEGSVGPGMTLSGPLGTNEMQSISTSIQASCFQNFDYDPQFTS